MSFATELETITPEKTKDQKMNSAEKDIILDNIVANREAAQRFMRNDYSGLLRDQNLRRRIDRKALLKGITTPSKITDAQLKSLIR